LADAKLSYSTREWSPYALRILSKTRTPPPAIFMVNEGVEKLSRDPIEGYRCLPLRPDGYCMRFAVNPSRG